MATPTATTSTSDTSPFFIHTLENGLQILGQRMPDLESVAVCFHVRTGARDEHDPALYGVSHFLEHMVFKGTATRDTERITLDFNLMGAEFNAFTSVEQTVFYAHILGEYLPNAIDLLSDMMRPRLDGEDFALERNVILEEIARAEDNPTGQAYRRLMQTYFAHSSLGHDVLGTKESIRDMAVEQMRAYQARRYAANNMILAIAGNFDPDHLLALDGDRQVMRFLEHQIKSREQIRDQLLPGLLACYDRYGGLGHWAANTRSDGQFIGWFGLRPVTPTAAAMVDWPDALPGDISVISLGYRLRASAWGQGYATEGARALVRRAFPDLGVSQIVATTMAANTASRRVLEKAGLKYVRTVYLDWPDPVPGNEHGDVEYRLDRNDQNA